MKSYINMDITNISIEKILFMVHVQILTIKADILTNTVRKTVLTASQDADGGGHSYIKNSILTRSTKNFL